LRKPLEELFLIAYRRSLFFCEPPDSRGQVKGRGGKESGRFVQKEKVLARGFHGSPAAYELNPRLVFNPLEFAHENHAEGSRPADVSSAAGGQVKLFHLDQAHVALAHGRLAQVQAACFLRSTN